jgi:uncharacterized protein (DUF433 family)
MIEWRQHLTSDPQICHGQLCAKGTRVFRPEHIDAAIAYAAELAKKNP